jgi:hypothetical protein
MLETDHAQDAKFRENFFRDFAAMVEKYPPVCSIPVMTSSTDGLERRRKGQVAGEMRFQANVRVL